MDRNAKVEIRDDEGTRRGVVYSKSRRTRPMLCNEKGMETRWKREGNERETRGKREQCKDGGGHRVMRNGGASSEGGWLYKVVQGRDGLRRYEQ